jgi:hypothetical protein
MTLLADINTAKTAIETFRACAIAARIPIVRDAEPAGLDVYKQVAIAQAASNADAALAELLTRDILSRVTALGI